MSSLHQAIICNTNEQFNSIITDRRITNPVCLKPGMYFEACGDLHGCVFDMVIIHSKVDRTTDQFIMLYRKVQRRVLPGYNEKK